MFMAQYLSPKPMDQDLMVAGLLGTEAIEKVHNEPEDLKLVLGAGYTNYFVKRNDLEAIVTLEEGSNKKEFKVVEDVSGKIQQIEKIGERIEKETPIANTPPQTGDPIEMLVNFTTKEGAIIAFEINWDDKNQTWIGNINDEYFKVASLPSVSDLRFKVYPTNWK